MNSQQYVLLDDENNVVAIITESAGNKESAIKEAMQDHYDANATSVTIGPLDEKHHTISGNVVIEGHAGPETYSFTLVPAHTYS